jgi:hypothetical protein
VRRGEWIAATAIYLLLAVVFLGQGLLPGHTMWTSESMWSEPPFTREIPADVRAFGANHELIDPATQFEPFLRYTRDRLPDVPLWNPFVMGGRPLLANAQSAVFSPYTVPGYVLPIDRSLVFSELLKLLVASLGTFFFARVALRMRFSGALLAGVVYAYGLFMVAWLPWPLASVWSYIPWLLLLADRCARAPGPGAMAGLSGVVALQFTGGHPESSFHALALTAVWFALRLVQRGRAEGRRAVVRPLAAGAGSLALGALLAAVALVPLAELLRHSSDVQERAHMGPAVVPRRTLAGVVLSDWFGRPTQSVIGPDFLVERAYYAGVVTLVLAAIALLRPTVERVLFALLGAGSLAVVVGVHPLTKLIRLLPGFSTAHNTRLIIVYLIAVAVLAGMGLDDLTTRRPLPWRWHRRAVAALIAGLIVVPVAVCAARGYLHHFGEALKVAWGFHDQPDISAPDSRGIIRLASLLVLAGILVPGALLIGARLRNRIGPALFAGLIVALVAADLFRAGMGENPAVAEAHNHLPTTPAIHYLQSRRPARFVGASTYNAFPLFPNFGMRFGLYDARGYDYPIIRRYYRLWRRAVAPQPGFAPPTILAPINPAALRAYSLLGVADVIQAPDAPPLHGPGLKLAYRGRDAMVYANRNAMPRATVVGAVRVVRDGDAALGAVTAPGFDPRRDAVAEHPIAGLPSSSPLGLGTVGAARLTHYGPERLTVRARAATPALVIVNDVFYPGWKATVDGRPAPIEQVDYLLRGVRVGPGTHTVEMRYEPASWRIGWIVTLVALAAWIALTAYAVAVHRRTARAR